MSQWQGSWPPPGAATPPPVPRPSRGWDLALAAVLVLSLVSIAAHALPVAALARTPRGPVVAAPGSTPAGPAGGSGSSTGPATTGSTPTGVGETPAPTAVPAVPAYDEACLRRDNPPTGATLPPGDPFGDDLADLGDKAELQRLYAVADGRLTPLDGLGAPRPCDVQLFAVITATAPTLVEHLEQLLIFDANPDPRSGEWVIEGEAVPKSLGADRYDDDRWRLSFAPNGLDREGLAWLVAHELAHLASLNSEQMLEGIGRDICATWFTGTGCLLRDAWLYRYVANTWPRELLDEWDKASEADTPKGRRAAYDKLYQAHKSSFVTAYAATHPFEDFAESFALWCTSTPEDRRRTKLPTGQTSDSGSKVAWFTAAKRDLAAELGPGCQMLAKFAAS